MSDAREEGFADAAHLALEAVPVGACHRAPSGRARGRGRWRLFDDVESLWGVEGPLGDAYDAGPIDADWQPAPI